MHVHNRMQGTAVRYAVANYLWHPLDSFTLASTPPMLEEASNELARPGGHSKRDDGLVMGCWLSDTEPGEPCREAGVCSIAAIRSLAKGKRRKKKATQKHT